MLIIAQEFPRVKKPTFNLPLMSGGETLKGTSSSQYHGQRTVGGLPDINGWFNLIQNQWEAADGDVINAFWGTNQGAVYTHYSGMTTANRTIGFRAGRNQAIYGASPDKVEPFGYWMYHIIKY